MGFATKIQLIKRKKQRAILHQLPLCLCSRPSTGVIRTSTLAQNSGDGYAPAGIQPPKWRVWKSSGNEKERKIPSTRELQRVLRHQTWANSIQSSGSFVDFTTQERPDTKSEKIDMNLPAYLFSTT